MKQMRFNSFLGVRKSGHVFLLAAACAAAAPATAAPVKRQEMVPMRDGTRLATDVYLPNGVKDPLPAVLVRTPYSKEKGGEVAAAACAAGYAFVVQDMRGRFKSEGDDFLVFHNDGWAGKNRDGHDTIHWITRQPWSNGKVATWGGSALGITQNMLAPDAPEALKAQHVSVAFSNMYPQAAFQGGAFRKELCEMWLDKNQFHSKNLESVIAHPRYDALWAEVNPESQAHRAHAPAVFYGGWYDIFLQGTIDGFLALHTRGKGDARGNCRLVVGPWAHGKFEELTYPANSRAPKAADAFRFFGYWLQGNNNGVPQDKPVHYYVMGDPAARGAPGNFWRAADLWPPPSRPTNYYFHLDGRLSPELPKEDGKRSYQYDPNSPVPTIGGQNLNIAKGPMDQRAAESRADVLLFTTDALAEPVEVTGRLHAKLYVESDCRDTDFTVKLTDVYPDGRSMLLTDGILRTRSRESIERESFLEPGKVYEITVDLWSTSIVFNRGHKIRVAVSSSNSPRFDPNPNTGKPFRADKETRVATNTLHLSRRYPSHIILPVYAGQGAAGE